MYVCTVWNWCIIIVYAIWQMNRKKKIKLEQKKKNKKYRRCGKRKNLYIYVYKLQPIKLVILLLNLWSNLIICGSTSAITYCVVIYSTVQCSKRSNVRHLINFVFIFHFLLAITYNIASRRTLVIVHNRCAKRNEIRNTLKEKCFTWIALPTHYNLTNT